MSVFIDADACPKAIKAIIYKAAMRTGVEFIFVANRLLSIPKHHAISAVKVDSGFDVADNYIVQHLKTNDMVVTADIILADLAINKQAIALNPRGQLYTKENIKQRLATRDLMESLRSSGEKLGGPKALHNRDIQNFANALDRYLARQSR